MVETMPKHRHFLKRIELTLKIHWDVTYFPTKSRFCTSAMLIAPVYDRTTGFPIKSDECSGKWLQVNLPRPRRKYNTKRRIWSGKLFDKTTVFDRSTVSSPRTEVMFLLARFLEPNLNYFQHTFSRVRNVGFLYKKRVQNSRWTFLKITFWLSSKPTKKYPFEEVLVFRSDKPKETLSLKHFLTREWFQTFGKSVEGMQNGEERVVT